MSPTHFTPGVVGTGVVPRQVRSGADAPGAGVARTSQCGPAATRPRSRMIERTVPGTEDYALSDAFIGTRISDATRTARSSASRSQLWPALNKTVFQCVLRWRLVWAGYRMGACRLM